MFAIDSGSLSGTSGYLICLTINLVTPYVSDTHRVMTRPLSSHVTPDQVQGLPSFIHPFSCSPLLFVSLNTSFKAQNCSAAPTPVELALDSGRL